MLVIRFFRVGKKKQPSFKIVVTDKRRPTRAGRFVEEVGFYNPLTKEKVFRSERIKHWLSVGAKPSDTVYNLLVGEKILEGKKLAKHKASKKKSASTSEVPEKKEETPAPEKPVEEIKQTPAATLEGGEPRPNNVGREAAEEETPPVKPAEEVPEKEKKE
jgi:small subunit ribosomal protein S16